MFLRRLYVRFQVRDSHVSSTSAILSIQACSVRLTLKYSVHCPTSPETSDPIRPPRVLIHLASSVGHLISRVCFSRSFITAPIFLWKPPSSRAFMHSQVGALMLTISLYIHRRYQISNIKSRLRSGNLIVIFLCLLVTGDLSCSLWSFFASYLIPRHDPSKLMLSVLPRQASPEITYFSFTLLPYIITLFVAHCVLNCTHLTLCNALSLANLGTRVIF